MSDRFTADFMSALNSASSNGMALNIGPGDDEKLFANKVNDFRQHTDSDGYMVRPMKLTDENIEALLDTSHIVSKSKEIDPFTKSFGVGDSAVQRTVFDYMVSKSDPNKFLISVTQRADQILEFNKALTPEEAFGQALAADYYGFMAVDLFQKAGNAKKAVDDKPEPKPAAPKPAGSMPKGGSTQTKPADTKPAAETPKTEPKSSGAAANTMGSPANPFVDPRGSKGLMDHLGTLIADHAPHAFEGFMSGLSGQKIGQDQDGNKIEGFKAHPTHAVFHQIGTMMHGLFDTIGNHGKGFIDEFKSGYGGEEPKSGSTNMAHSLGQWFAQKRDVAKEGGLSRAVGQAAGDVARTGAKAVTGAVGGAFQGLTGLGGKPAPKAEPAKPAAAPGSDWDPAVKETADNLNTYRSTPTSVSPAGIGTSPSHTVGNQDGPSIPSSRPAGSDGLRPENAAPPGPSILHRVGNVINSATQFSNQVDSPEHREAVRKSAVTELEDIAGDDPGLCGQILLDALNMSKSSTTDRMIKAKADSSAPSIAED